MLKLLHCILLFLIASCSSQKHAGKNNDENVAATGLTQIEIGKNSSVKLSVHSNIDVPVVTEVIKKQFEIKNIHILNDAEYKELSQKHFYTAYKIAGGNGKTIPDGKRITELLKTTESYIDCLYFYCEFQSQDFLTLDSLHYSYGKYPKTGNLKRINFDISQFPDKSLVPVVDSLINQFLNYKERNKK